MLDAIKRLFRRLTPAEAAARELADAELALLQANTAREYAEAIGSYHRQRIARLKAYLATAASTSAPKADA